MAAKKAKRTRDALERQNPLGIIKGDLSERLFGGMRFSQSIIAPNKKVAKARAEGLRGKGVLVRVVKLSSGYGLYTR